MSNRDVQWRCFEDEVFQAVERAVKTGYFPLVGDIRVKRGVRYVVPATESTIEIEVSLEAYRKDASEPFLIWLWECKHKETREVEVGDVRELHSKIQELGVGRAKGSIVTTRGFQSGAIELAKSLGIGLYLLDKELVPIMKYAKDEMKEIREVIFALSSVDLAGKERPKTRFDDLVRWGVRQAATTA